MLARREFSRSELKGRLQKALRNDARKQSATKAKNDASAPSRNQNVRPGRLGSGHEVSAASSDSHAAVVYSNTRVGETVVRPSGPLPDCQSDRTVAGGERPGFGGRQTPAMGYVAFGADDHAARSTALDGSLSGEVSGDHDDSMIIGAVLDALVAVGSLSDERFVSSFVSSRIRRGKGPVLIRAELRDRGVDEELVDRFLTFSDAYWVDKARSARNKRFGDTPPADAAERNRQARFLAGRGFASELIRRVVMVR